VKKTYSTGSLFIGARGQFQEIASVWPLWVFQGTCVYSDVPRVMFFTRIRDFVRGIGSSESTRFPDGLVLGNWAKTLSPSKCWICRIHEKCRELSSTWKMLFRGKGNTHEDIQMKITHFADLLIICKNNSRIGFGLRVYCMFQDNWNLVRFRRSGTCGIQESEGTSVRESRWVMIFGKKLRESVKRPSQRRHFKSPGWKCELVQTCKCMKSTPQITGCKRYSCTCSH
jgi:hypothetical protein